MNLDALRRRFEPVTRRVLHFYWRFSRGLTLGVRAVVIDHSGKVFLIVHSYIPAGVAGRRCRIETAAVALARNCAKRGNIQLVEQPVLFGVALIAAFRGTIIALYIVELRRDAPRNQLEDRNTASAPTLPAETTRATRERLAEVLNGRKPAELW